jgi:N6-L-threonylcarbamoyladenine synthase
MNKPYITLGIETSCDETGVAVYHSQHGMLSNALFSQIAIHKNFGGVIPEIASRTQLEKIIPITRYALEKAQVSLDAIDTIAVTHKPGLPGSLLVGLCFAKSLAWAKNKKIIGINHLEGHAFSACIENTVPFPHLCITASGGHTSLYLVHDYGKYEILGQTNDDAAGEAFDKIAKVLNLPYPGGPEIEQRAQHVNFQDFFNYPRHKEKTLDFSFSGLKTAVIYDLMTQGAYNLTTKKLTNDSQDLKNQVASSLLVCIADVFQEKLQRALCRHPEVKAITFVGGVACNNYLKHRLRSLAQHHNKQFFTPSPQYCTDNGGMIAFVGNYKARQGLFSDLHLDIA